MFTIHNTETNNEQEFGNIGDVQEFLEDHAEEFAGKSAFDEFLDDTNENIKVLGEEYSPSHVLFAVDKVVYDLNHGYYQQEIINDAISELDSTDDVTIGDYHITSNGDE